MRLLLDHRQGYAWAGSLDPDVVAETVAEARDNAGFGTQDECARAPRAVPTSRRSRPPDLDLWREALLAVPAEEKVALALEVEAATRARGSAGARASSPRRTATARSRSRSRARSASRPSARRTVCSVASFAMAGEGEETQTGYGFSVGRTFADLDVAAAARDAAERSTRLLGARQPASRRLPVILDPLVTRSLLGLLGAALSGEAMLKGRSMFVGRDGRRGRGRRT